MLRPVLLLLLLLVPRPAAFRRLRRQQLGVAFGGVPTPRLNLAQLDKKRVIYCSLLSAILSIHLLTARAM